MDIFFVDCNVCRNLQTNHTTLAHVNFSKKTRPTPLKKRLHGVVLHRALSRENGQYPVRGGVPYEVNVVPSIAVVIPSPKIQ